MSSPFDVLTLKRRWTLTTEIAVARPTKICRILLSLFKNSKNEFEIYNYFTEQGHIDWSNQEALEFIQRWENVYRIPSSEVKSILDISGGNGIVTKKISEHVSAKITLTEVNEQALQYATNQLGLKSHSLDLNSKEFITGKYDLVLMRACIMFVDDLEDLCSKLRGVINPGGHIIIEHSVHPTLGVLLRTQLDNYSYHILRSPDNIKDTFERNGFKFELMETEIDPSAYVFDSDYTIKSHFFYVLFENWNLKRLVKRDPSLRRRDRVRTSFMFTLQSSKDES
jgi:SAM-dependent methyltransferase